jgi:serine/threonine protein phosphatase PrpC
MQNKVCFDSVKVFSLSKSTPVENEDKFHLSNDEKFISVSDGAGGFGLFANEWASCLVDQINIQHIGTKEIFGNQLKQLKIDYFNQKEEWLNENNPEYLEKFFREGSAATYVGVHFREDVSVFRAIAYGDSAFFLYRPLNNSLIASNVNLETYIQYPYLIDCIDPEIDPAQLFFEDIEYQKGDVLILASDAIAQYLLINFMLSNPEYSNTINQFLNYPHSLANFINANLEIQANSSSPFISLIEKLFQFNQEDFQDFIKELQLNQCIGTDDYTLILMEL